MAASSSSTRKRSSRSDEDLGEEERVDKQQREKKEKKTKKEKKDRKDRTDKEEKKKEKKSEKSQKRQRTQNGEEPSARDQEVHELPEDPLTIALYEVSQERQNILKSRGITKFFPIQGASYATVLAGRDVLGRARTGTGKTLAFSLPIIERLMKEPSQKSKWGRAPRVLVMSPTRELAKQIEEEFTSLASDDFSVVCIYGGAPFEPQERALHRGVDIVVGTPGRIIDHIDRGNMRLDAVEYAVLDEADKMLSIGFAEEMERVLSAIPRKTPEGEERKVQTLLFSATIPPTVQSLCNRYLLPNSVTIDLVSSQDNKTSTGIRHLALQCMPSQRNAVIGDIVKMYSQADTVEGARTIVFTDTKAEANELALNSTIAADCAVLHGDIAQSQREVTLKGFKEGRFPILVATDVAARGLDIQGVSLVINVRPPTAAEDYVHRSGRTGRAGAQGVCVTFFTNRDEGLVRMLERQTGTKLERIGAPQTKDIIDAVVKKAVGMISEVHPSMVALFADSAKKLIAESSDVQTLLAGALAHIAGYRDEVKPKSLLEGVEGYTTIMLKGQQEYRSPKFVIAILEGVHTCTRGSDANTLGVKGVRICADGSALADVPSNQVQKLLEKAERDPYCRFELSVPTSLPELQERPPAARRDSVGFADRGRGFGGDRDRRGGRSSGFGGRSSGFGGGRSNGFGGSSGGFDRRSSGGRRW